MKNDSFLILNLPLFLLGSHPIISTRQVCPHPFTGTYHRAVIRHRILQDTLLPRQLSYDSLHISSCRVQGILAVFLGARIGYWGKLFTQFRLRWLRCYIFLLASWQVVYCLDRQWGSYHIGSQNEEVWRWALLLLDHQSEERSFQS